MNSEIEKGFEETRKELFWFFEHEKVQKLLKGNNESLAEFYEMFTQHNPAVFITKKLFFMLLIHYLKVNRENLKETYLELNPKIFKYFLDMGDTVVFPSQNIECKREGDHYFMIRKNNGEIHHYNENELLFIITELGIDSWQIEKKRFGF